jgi:hypothetical protein
MKTGLFIVGVIFCIVIPAAVSLIVVNSAKAPEDFLNTGLSHLMVQKQVSSHRESSVDTTGGNRDGWQLVPLMPGETRVMAELEGPGVVTHIWNTMSGADDNYLRTFVLRVYWDGQESPSIEVPLGDFFVEGNNMEVEFASLPVSVSSNGRARNCYFPMPFEKSAVFTITNEGDIATHAFYYYIDYVKLPRWNPRYRYFHVQYQQAHSGSAGHDFTILETTGQGHYVGTVFNVKNNSPGWWGEGDDLFYIDGVDEPTLLGTGSEDYFNNAYGMRRTVTPYYGATVSESRAIGSRCTNYRWHIEDPIVFDRSLKVAIEHSYGRQNDGNADQVSSVAFWYQMLPSPEFPAFPPAVERIIEPPTPEQRELGRLMGLRESGHYVSSIAGFEHLLADDPNNMTYVRALAQLYIGFRHDQKHDSRNPDKGLQYVSQMLADNSEDSGAIWLKAYAYILKAQRGDTLPVDAKIVFDKALSVYKDSEYVKTLIAKYR